MPNHDLMKSGYLLAPDPDQPGLCKTVKGVDHSGARVELPVIEERPLTIFLNRQEIVTAITIGDHPKYLGLGFLRNQGMIGSGDELSAIDYDEDTGTVVVRTKTQTDHEAKLRKKTRTSGCAIGTVFGDMMEGMEGLRLPQISVRVSQLYALSKVINTTPSLYLRAGAIHGTVLCQGSRPLVYMEDVGRHNAVDKISGWMALEGVGAADKLLYTTGRLTSEMVIKCALMGIPALVSRSGFTAWGIEIARRVGLVMVGRLRGNRFMCLSGSEQLIWDVAQDRPVEPEVAAKAKGGARI